MKQKIFRWILVLSVLYVSCSVVYAESMNLIYDGKSHTYSSKPIHLYIDGQEIVTTVMPPIQLNNNILVPAKEVFVTVGAEVEWRPLEQSVYIYNDDILIVLEINSYEAWVNGETKSLNVPAKLINDKVMIPLRFISESLGYTVTWSQSNYSVNIITPQNAGDESIDNSIEVDDSLNSGNSVENVESNEDLGGIMTEEQIPSQEESVLPEINIEPTINNEYISYDELTSTLMLKNIVGVSANQIVYEENPHTKQIIVDLNGDYSQSLPAESFIFQTGKVKQMDITQYNGQTRLILTTDTISALLVGEQEGQVMMQIVKPSEKYSKIVVLDAGHGAHDSGTSYAGIKEKDLNLLVSNELYRLLENDPSIKVYTTRDDDTFLELMERVTFSNEIEPDLFISMHVNSVVGNTAASGTETYYTVDYDTRNKTFATMVQEALVQEFGTRNRGVKTANFVVTRYTDAPAILIEIGFITNDSDRAMMTSSGFESRYAQAVYQCILNYYAQGLHLGKS